MLETLDPIVLTGYVENSAKQLDIDHPGWHEEINPDELQMASTAYCVAGRLDLTGPNPDPRSFWDDDDECNAQIHYSITRGFYIPYGVPIFGISNARDGFDKGWDFLKELWVAEIAKRN